MGSGHRPPDCRLQQLVGVLQHGLARGEAIRLGGQQPWRDAEHAHIGVGGRGGR